MVRYSKKHSMDPSITSKTTILFDVTTILLSLLQQLLMIDCIVLSRTVIDFFKQV
jgi:hypothetical protein